MSMLNMTSKSIIEVKNNSQSNVCQACGNSLSQGSANFSAYPEGVKFEPTDEQIMRHLAAKLGIGGASSHPDIDKFIPTLSGPDGMCGTHPDLLPGSRRDGVTRHYFHRPAKAYSTGERKRRKVQIEEDGEIIETRWHKTGKTRAVFVNSQQVGCKKILVMYSSSKKSGSKKEEKDVKTNWIMHQYHWGLDHEEREGEWVVSKIFWQTQPRQTNGKKAEPENEEEVQKSSKASKSGGSSLNLTGGSLLRAMEAITGNGNEPLIPPEPDMHLGYPQGKEMPQLLQVPRMDHIPQGGLGHQEAFSGVSGAQNMHQIQQNLQDPPSVLMHQIPQFQDLPPLPESSLAPQFDPNLPVASTLPPADFAILSSQEVQLTSQPFSSQGATFADGVISTPLEDLGRLPSPEPGEPQAPKSGEKSTKIGLSGYKNVEEEKPKLAPLQGNGNHLSQISGDFLMSQGQGQLSIPGSQEFNAIFGSLPSLSIQLEAEGILSESQKTVRQPQGGENGEIEGKFGENEGERGGNLENEGGEPKTEENTGNADGTDTRIAKDSVEALNYGIRKFLQGNSHPEEGNEKDNEILSSPEEPSEVPLKETKPQGSVKKPRAKRGVGVLGNEGGKRPSQGGKKLRQQNGKDSNSAFNVYEAKKSAFQPFTGKRPITRFLSK